MVDLAGVPVVDSHCHPWRNETLLAADPAGFEDRVTVTGTMLGTSGAEGFELRTLTESTPFALAMRRRLAAFLGCEPTREAVAAARHAALAADAPGYLSRLLRDAGV